MPPLRERPDDIILLAHHLADEIGKRLNKPSISLTSEAIEAFSSMIGQETYVKCKMYWKAPFNWQLAKRLR